MSELNPPRFDVTVRVFDLGVDDEFADLTEQSRAALRAYNVRRRSDADDALAEDEVHTALAAGAAVAHEEIAAGAQLLISGDLGTGDTDGARSSDLSSGWRAAGATAYLFEESPLMHRWSPTVHRCWRVTHNLLAGIVRCTIVERRVADERASAGFELAWRGFVFRAHVSSSRLTGIIACGLELFLLDCR
ncbi:hypothetical protein BH09ACT8_BH09ACT8_32970 [soil metagenome]